MILSHPDLPFTIEQDITGRYTKRDEATGRVEPASSTDYLLMMLLCRVTDLEAAIRQPASSEAEQTSIDCPDGTCSTNKTKRKS